uniref:Microtubule-associated protein TORTIFOLIA1 n=1 Tax=Musa acuminata subsp. malaccensis TaxID=214687 RepID=A0A804KIE5_MUSAM|nr:PREDICTED: microtubule-associated protein SPIRAL2-like [Musa acuminata subsp. malaccensis]
MATSSISRPSSKLSKSPSRSHNPSNSSSSSKSQSSSSLSSHLAMVELKSRVLSALSKLSDRDTHQIAVDDLEKIIRTLPADGVPMLLHALIHDPSMPSPSPQDPPGSKNPSFLVGRRESLRLLALLCASHTDAASAHLPRIMAHIVRRLKDPASDSSVRDACRDAAGSLAALYLRPSLAAAAAHVDGAGSGGPSPVVALFVKPLFEAMGEQNKAVQGGAAMCLAKVVESAGGGGVGGGGQREEGRVMTTGVVFQKLCPRICKLLGGQSFLAKGALLSVISSLAQVGAISPQSMQQVLQTIRECLENSDWATRKAAADTLCVLASHSSHVLGDGATATITALEACRFDKVKPVRDSMMEALQLWKKIRGDGTLADTKDSRSSDLTDNEEKEDHKRFNPSKKLESLKISSAGFSSGESDSVSKENGTNMLEKATVLLMKKAPSLTDKELNPEFFQKLEKRSLDDFPVEVVLPRRCLQSSHSQCEEGSEVTCNDSTGTSNCDGAALQESDDTHGYNTANYRNEDKRPGPYKKVQDLDNFARDKWTEQRGSKAKESKAKVLNVEDTTEVCQKDPSPGRTNVPRSDANTDGPFMSNRANWTAIQRQLAQLERQQASLMNMLQDFIGGSHDSMVTLENRVRGLERVVEEMAHDLAMSSGRRVGNMMLGFDKSPGRSSSKYNGLHDYSSSKFGRVGERFHLSDGLVTGVRGRDSPWRSESEAWDSYGYVASRNGVMNTRRGFGAVPVDGRLHKTEHDTDQVSGRRAWNKGPGPFRLGEGPSARSVWQASKDEATLEAIRVAGEDNGTSRNAARVAVPELDAEALTDDNPGPDKGPLWASWTRAMDSLHVGDIDSAYEEILSTGDDLLLVKLMDKSGPVFDQLSGEIASEVLHAVGQFILEQSLFDIALNWLQQLSDLVVENGADFLRVPLEWKREILLNLHEASALELPEDWEGAAPDQLMMHLASAWGLNLQQLVK